MIHTKNLTKLFRVYTKEEGFRGSIKSLFNRTWIDREALKGVSLDVQAGEIVGLVGANGAGKTTLIKILTGIIHPTSGTAEVLGFKPWERKNEFRRQIGLLMGQKAQLWWDLPAADCFVLLREIYEIPDAQYRETLNALAETLRVKDLLKVPVRRLSLGERMKMELIAVLLHRPRVLFLDEPTLGLDISSQRAIRKFLLEYAKNYKPAMLITSHYMEDIEELCERIVIIREGGFVYDGPLQQVREQYIAYKTISAHLSQEVSLDQIRQIVKTEGENEIDLSEGSLRIRVLRGEIAQVVSSILQHLPILDLSIEEEDIANIIESIMLSKEKVRHVA